MPRVGYMTNDFGITDELLDHVQAAESLSCVAYKDPVGLPTIGWGHRIPDMRHPPVTEEEAAELLRDDLRAARDQLLALSPGLIQTTPRRVAALADFVFNVGAGNYRGSTLRKCVDQGDWPGAAREIRRWVYGHDPAGNPVKLAGLVKRRETEAEWLQDG